MYTTYQHVINTNTNTVVEAWFRSYVFQMQTLHVLNPTLQDVVLVLIICMGALGRVHTRD